VTGRALIVVSWMLAWLLTAPAARATDTLLLLERAEFVASDSPEPPPDSAPWQPQTLPDDWRLSRPGRSGFGWYRIVFDRDGPLPTERQAVYVAWMRTVGAVWINGTLVGQSDDFGRAKLGPRPQLYSFAPGLLRQGRNVVHVRLWVGDVMWIGRLWPLQVGPLAAATAAFDRGRVMQVALSDMSFVFSLTVGAIMLLIWFGRRRDTMFGLFGVSAVCWALYVAFDLGYLNRLVGGLARPTVVSVVLADVATGLLFSYALRFVGWRRPRMEFAVWTLLALDVVGIGQLHAELLQAAFPDRPWTQLFNFLFLASYAALAVVAAAVWRRPNRETLALLIGYLASVAMLVLLVASQRWPVSLDHFHFVPLLALIGWLMTLRFVRSLNAAESMNVELDRRVAEKSAELERRFRETEELGRLAALAAERQRIMSDMHDGVGAQLISTLSLVEHGQAAKEQVAAALRECIDDLRLAIDSLEPADGELAPVLGGLRYRLEPRLKAVGIALDWQVKDLPKLACLTPQNVLHVLRILQEAFTNVLKHAGAQCIRVVTRVEAGQVSIEVQDDGRGWSPTGPRDAGHGLANMRRRAAAVGGTLDVQASPSGTTLALRLPLAGAADQPA
jgi:signal transduction histidine kinase